MKGQSTISYTPIDSESEKLLAQQLRGLNSQLDHQKPTQKLSDIEIARYLALTKTLEKLADLYFNQANHLNQQRKQKIQIKQDQQTDVQIQQQILDLENQSGELLTRSSMLLNAAIAIRQKRNPLHQTPELTQELNTLITKLNQIEIYFLTEIMELTPENLQERGYDLDDQDAKWQKDQKTKLVQVKYKQPIDELRSEIKRRLKEELQSLEELNQQIERVQSQTQDEKTRAALTEAIYYQRAQVIRETSVSTSIKLKEFLKTQLQECIKICGTPPCDYSIILLGSIAKQTATPYSDIEFAILIDEEHKGNQQIKQYFRNLSRLFCLRINNLGESTIPESWYHTSFNDAYTMGVGFDLGGKTPLNRKRDQDVYIDGRLAYPKGSEKYDLVVTPSEMMTYFDEKYFSIDKWLSFEISNFTHLISSDKTQETELPFEKYQDLLTTFERVPDPKTQLPNYRVRSLMIMYEGIEQIEQLPDQQLKKTRIIGDLHKYSLDSLTDEEHQGALYRVKQDIYRLPDRLIEGLCIFYGIKTISKNSWQLIEELAQEAPVPDSEQLVEQKTKRPKIISQIAKENLQIMLSVAVELRLSYDLSHQSQLGMVSVIGSLCAEFDQEGTSSKHRNFSKEQLELLEKFYRIALPFHQKLNEFYSKFSKQESDTKRKTLSDDFFKELTFYDNSNITTAKIYIRFLQYQKAFNCLKKEKKSEELDMILIFVLHKLGRYWEAKGLAEGLLKTNPNDISVLQNLAAICCSLSLYQESDKYYQRFIKGPMELHVVVNYTLLLEKSGRYFEAEGMFLKALELVGCGRNAKRATICSSLGNLYLDMSRIHEAIKYHQEALDLRKTTYGDIHLIVSDSLVNLSNVYQKISMFDKAKEYRDKAGEIQHTIHGNDTSEGNNPSLIEATQHQKLQPLNPDELTIERNKISYLIEITTDKKKLQEILKKALINLKNTKKCYKDKPHTNTAEALDNIGIIYSKLNDFSNSIHYAKRGLLMRKKIYGKLDNIQIVISLHNLAVSYHEKIDSKHIKKSHNWLKAHKNYRKALAMLERLFDSFKSFEIQLSNLIKVLESLRKMGDVSGKKQQVQEAIYKAFGADNIQSLEEKLVDIKQNLVSNNHQEIRKKIKENGGIEKLLTTISNNLSRSTKKSKFNPLTIYKKHFFEIQVDNLIKVFEALENKTFKNSEDKDILKRKLADKFGLIPDSRPLIEQLKEKKENQKFKVYTTGQRGVENLLKDLEIDEFNPLEIYKSYFHFPHYEKAKILNDMGLFFIRDGTCESCDKALKLHREALAIQQKVFLDYQPYDMAITHSKIADCYIFIYRDYKKPSSNHKKTLCRKIEKQEQIPYQTELTDSDKKNLELAYNHYQEAYKIIKPIFSHIPCHEVVTILLGVAFTSLAIKKYGEALNCCKKAKEIIDSNEQYDSRKQDMLQVENKLEYTETIFKSYEEGKKINVFHGKDKFNLIIKVGDDTLFYCQTFANSLYSPVLSSTQQVEVQQRPGTKPHLPYRGIINTKHSKYAISQPC